MCLMKTPKQEAPTPVEPPPAPEKTADAVKSPTKVNRTKKTTRSKLRVKRKVKSGAAVGGSGAGASV